MRVLQDFPPKMRSRMKWCVVCQTHHSNCGTRLKHEAPVYQAPRDFIEYAEARFNGLSEEARQNMMGDSYKMMLFRSLWAIQYAESLGQTEEANEARRELDDSLSGVSSMVR